MKRTILFVMAIGLLASACGLQGTEANEVGLIYSGGAFEDKEFKGFLKSGATAEGVGVGSKVYRYPTNQRSYIGNGKNNGADAPPVQVASKEDVRLWVDYEMYFKLNRTGEGEKDCNKSVMCQFHENIGTKTHAWTTEGWRATLAQYFQPHIERSMDAAALKFGWKEMRTTEEGRVRFQNEAIANIKQAIRQAVGGEYFCGPDYAGPGSPCTEFSLTVSLPTPVNEDIVKAVESEQTFKANTIAQEQRNAQITKELEAERELVKLYGPQGALLREAIKSGKVQQFIIDESDRSTVQAGGK